MPNLFLAFVIFMLVLIGLSCKNNTLSCILTHFQLTNNLINATVTGNDRSWLVFSQKFKASLQRFTAGQKTQLCTIENRVFSFPHLLRISESHKKETRGLF